MWMKGVFAMKCPQCGKEMTLDNHRKYPIYMCYSCGHVTDFNENSEAGAHPVNFSYIKTLSETDLAAYMARGLGVDESKLLSWLKETTE
jgi:uncharacterized Zn finger protein